MAEGKDDKMWMGIGVALVLFLIVTTPGWKEVMGISNLPDLSGWSPALVLFLFIGGLLAIVMMSGNNQQGGE